jgi:hypothetical protein
MMMVHPHIFTNHILLLFLFIIDKKNGWSSMYVEKSQVFTMDVCDTGLLTHASAYYKSIPVMSRAPVGKLYKNHNLQI